MTPMSRQDEGEVAADFAHDKAKDDRITAEMEARDKPTTLEELAQLIKRECIDSFNDEIVYEQSKAAALIAEAFERWATAEYRESSRAFDSALARAERAEARVRELEAMLAWAMTYVEATYEAEGDPIPSEQVLYLSARRAIKEARE